MKRWLWRMRTHRKGSLTFEWILVVTLLIVGIVGGISAIRDAIIDELGDIAAAALAVDQSWTMRFCTNCSTGSYVEVKWEDTTDGPVGRQRPSQPPIGQGP